MSIRTVYRISFIFFLILSLCYACKQKDHSDQNVIKKQTLSQQIEAQLQLSKQLEEKKDYQQSLDLVNQALAEAEKSGLDLLRAKIFLQKAEILIIMKQFADAMEAANQALNIYNKHNQDQGLIASLISQGRIHFKNKEYPQAMDIFLKVLWQCEHQKNPQYYHLNRSYLYLGLIHNRQQNFEKAFYYYHLGLKLAKTNHKPEDTAHFYNQTGIVYKNKAEQLISESKDAIPDLLKALEHFSQAMDEQDKVSRDWTYYVYKFNKAYTLKSLKRHQPAVMNFKDCLAYHRQQNNYPGICETLINLAEENQELKNDEKASYYYQETLNVLDKALQYSNRMLFDDLKKSRFYLSYAKFLYETGQFKQAYEYQKQAIALERTYVDEAKNREIARLEDSHKNRENQYQIQLLAKEKKVQLFIFIFSGLFIALMLGFLVKKYYYIFAFWKKENYISTFRIIKPIGEGGMGVVYLAHPLNDKNHQVAIKVLKEKLIDTREGIERFRREGTIIDSLNHPHIIKVFERGEHNGRLFIVTEYIAGQTLEEYILSEEKKPLPDLLQIMIQISQALQAVHAKKIVYRDLKPSNIMLSQNQPQSILVKLLDFGLAQTWYHSRLTQTGVLIGTLTYQAPEQLKNLDFDYASDIYSLGRIFYEMIAGEILFKGDSLDTIINGINQPAQKQPKELRDDVPRLLNQLIVDMLTVEAQFRPTIQKVLARLQKISLPQT